MSFEWLSAIAAGGAMLLVAVVVLMRRASARRAPVLRLKVARWSEPGWYLVGLGLGNRWRITVASTDLEATSPRRARLLERSFLERYAEPGPDGVRRPNPAAATRKVPLPMEAGPAGARVMLHGAAGQKPQPVAADRDQREVLLYVPTSTRAQEVRLTLHYVRRHQPDRRRQVRMTLEIPAASGKKS